MRLFHKLALAIVLMSLLVMLFPISVAMAADEVYFPDPKYGAWPEWSAETSFTTASSSLVGDWAFDEGTGTIVHDSSSYNNDGQIHNATWVPGVAGQALYFNGTDDSYVEVPDKPELTPSQQLVIEAWVRPESYSTDTMAILYKGDLEQTGCFGERSYSLWANRNGAIHFTWTPEGSNCQWIYETNGGVIPTDQWSHVEVELDAVVGRVLINVNDVPVLEEVCPTGVIRVGSLPLRIGGMFRSFQNQANFQGSIDEVKIYARTYTLPPNQPINVSPADEGTEVSITPTLQSSAFSDPDVGDTHAASQWQISTSAGSYSSPVYDSGTDSTNLTSITVPSGRLNYLTTYYWHVRHQDNNGAWSEYSSETSFTTEAAPTPTPTPTPATPTPTSPAEPVGGGGGGGGFCFIATAAYGSSLDSHVDTLRSFRDQYLETNPIGSAFVSLYYKVSPPMADFIDEHPTLKPIVRAGLMPAVVMSTVAVNTTLAEKIAIAASVLLFTALVVVWLRRKAVKGGF